MNNVQNMSFCRMNKLSVRFIAINEPTKAFTHNQPPRGSSQCREVPCQIVCAISTAMTAKPTTPSPSSVSRYPLWALGADQPMMLQISQASGLLIGPEGLVPEAEQQVPADPLVDEMPQRHPPRQGRVLSEQFQQRNEELVEEDQKQRRDLQDKQRQDNAAEAAPPRQHDIDEGERRGDDPGEDRGDRL